MKQNKERAISIISGEYYEDVLSTLPVTIANNSHVKGNIKAPKVTVGNHVVIEGNIEADNDITIGNMCEIGNMLSDENIFKNYKVVAGVVTWLDEEIDCAPEYMYTNSYEYPSLKSVV